MTTERLDPIGLYCYHIIAVLPEDYDRHKLPGYVDIVDGQSLSCGVLVKSSSKRKISDKDINKHIWKTKNMKIDLYFSKDKNQKKASCSSDSVDNVIEHLPYTNGNNKKANTSQDFVDNVSVESPWKLVVCHTGTKNVHWHFIYISSHSSFKNNSKLGKDIFYTKNKIQKINCIQCLYNYLHSGGGRQIIVDNMTDKYKYLLICEKHFNDLQDKVSFYGKENEYEEENLLRSIVASDVKKTNSIYYSNNELIELLIANRAFNESSARISLSKTLQGRNFMFKPKSNDTIKIAIQTAKIMIFQETPLERLKRSKIYFEKIYGVQNYMEQLNNLNTWLECNNIDKEMFAIITFKHFMKETGKKNNLFFKGPPSTGKSMIMQSLVSCHYNFTNLTGLIESSPFNFASLIYSNACFMDEIKVTDNHFEQWKLIASGQSCTTDVKYQEKCDISNCVLYTASNYDINMFCTVPHSKEAIEERTFTFEIQFPCKTHFTLSPNVWQIFWESNQLM